MKIIFNPFRYLAGGKALAIGLIAIAATTIIAYVSNTHFDGAIDIHYGQGQHFSFSLFICEQLIALGSTVIMFFIVGILLSKSSVRFIDVAGTISLARVVVLPAAILGFLPAMHINNIDQVAPVFTIGSILTITLSIWMVTLMYNAFVVSCNLKGPKAAFGFIVSLLVAEAISKLLNYKLSLFF